MATYLENSCSFGLRYVSWYKYVIVSLFFFPTLVFGVGIFFLIAPFPDLWLLVPFNTIDDIVLSILSASLVNSSPLYLVNAVWQPRLEKTSMKSIPT